MLRERGTTLTGDDGKMAFHMNIMGETVQALKAGSITKEYAIAYMERELELVKKIFYTEEKVSEPIYPVASVPPLSSDEQKEAVAILEEEKKEVPTSNEVPVSTAPLGFAPSTPNIAFKPAASQNPTLDIRDLNNK